MQAKKLAETSGGNVNLVITGCKDRVWFFWEIIIENPNRTEINSNTSKTNESTI